MFGRTVPPHGWRLAKKWAAAAVLGLGTWWASAAVAQPPAAPPRLVVQSTGKPGEFVVNGLAPPSTQLPAAPVTPAGYGMPTNNPPALMPPNAGVPVVPNASPPVVYSEGYSVDGAYPVGDCTSGRCKHGPRVGPSALNGVTFGECVSFNWHCCKTPATIPPPLGTNVRSVFDMQRGNALTEYFTVYREDWNMGTASLNSSGERHFDGIVRRLGLSASPIKIEPSGNADLDTVRRMAVIDALVRNGIPAPEATGRVVIGGTRAEGLRYNDIEAVYSRSIIIGIGGYGGSSGFGGGGGFGR